MTVPFKVFDGKFRHDGSTGYVWCVRCEDWIPVEVLRPGLGSFDPHVMDHYHAYQVIREVAVRAREVVGIPV